MKQPHSLLEMTAEGLYCPAGRFHVDPIRAVPCAVVTHAHADHARSGCGIYHASIPSVPLLKKRLDARADVHPLAWGEVVRFGPVSVSLHPAGHILGSAQVRVELGGEVWVVSGDYKREGDPTCRPFDPVACDTLITEATFALPIYRWPPVPDTVAAILEWWGENAEAGRASLIHCYALGKAQRLLAEIGAHTDRTVYIHTAIDELTSIYRASGVRMPPTGRISREPNGRSFAGELILAPPSARRGRWARRLGEHQSAFLSGWMLLRGPRRRAGYERGFVLSDHADWPALVRTACETGAKRVLTHHGYADVLARYLSEQGTPSAALESAGQPGSRGGLS